MLLGLHHMHSRKVLHRDMKTLNTFLDQQLNVKLGDLGVAKVRSNITVNHPSPSTPRLAATATLKPHANFAHEESVSPAPPCPLLQVLSTNTNFAKTVIGTPYYLSPGENSSMTIVRVYTHTSLDPHQTSTACRHGSCFVTGGLLTVYYMLL
jgi:serine/threonine protein kinase